MKERPILFSAPMVRALLDGTKTQTRRIFKQAVGLSLSVGMDDEAPGVAELSWLWGDGPGHEVNETIKRVACPYGQPGDRLWVKEQTIKVEDRGWIGPVYTESDAGRQALEWGYGEWDDPDHIPPHAIKRRPSIFMTRAMSRITLEITGVRVERLQDISEADSVAEGIPSSEVSPPDGGRFAYRLLWESINGAESWAENPWVWVVEFKRMTEGAAP